MDTKEFMETAGLPYFPVDKDNLYPVGYLPDNMTREGYTSWVELDVNDTPAEIIKKIVARAYRDGRYDGCGQMAKDLTELVAPMNDRVKDFTLKAAYKNTDLEVKQM